MTDTIKTVCVVLVLSVVVRFVTLGLESEFLQEFLAANLVTILIALLAINITTLSVILTKLREISDRFDGVDWSEVVREMRAGITEQLILVGLAVVLLTLRGSTRIEAGEYVGFGLAVGVVAVFLYALYLLELTAAAVFKILHFESEIQGNGGDGRGGQ